MAGGKGQKAGGQVEGAFFKGGSTIFRAVNFELFAKGNRTVAIGGSFLFLCAMGMIANMTPSKPKNSRRELHRDESR